MKICLLAARLSRFDMTQEDGLTQTIFFRSYTVSQEKQDEKWRKVHIY